jgi:hypothetical protein
MVKVSALSGAAGAMVRRRKAGARLSRWNALRPAAKGYSQDEDVVHKVMCKALDYQAEMNMLTSNEPARLEPSRR